MGKFSLIAVGVGFGLLLQVPAEEATKVSIRPIQRDFVQPVFVGMSEAELDIIDALERRVSVDFSDEPLRDVLAALSKEHSVPIRIEQLAFEDAGVSVDKKITLKSKRAKLREVLSEILVSSGIDWTVFEDSVVVTSDCSLMNLVAVYPIPDFMRHRGDVKAVSNLIRLSTNSMWESLDGAGGWMKRIRSSKSLVVAQPLSVQYEVMQILASLRAARRISTESGGKRNK